MQIKVLYLIDRLSVGGTEGQLRELVQGLNRERFQPHLGTIRTGGPEIEFPELPRLILNFKALHHSSTLRCLWQLSAYVRHHRIRIVQTFFQDSTALAAFSKPFHSARLVGSFRDLGFWRTSRETLKMRLAYPAFSGFIANSKAVKENFVRVAGVPADKIEVIYNGIYVDDAPAIASSLEVEPLVGIVSNLNRQVKRVHDFIHAAALVRGYCPEAKFIIIGDGHLRPQLEKLSQSLGLAGVLRFVGQVNRPIEFVRRFAVGVNTSETEGFSNAILEYMSCGVPVVATSAGGNLEMVCEGQNGYLVPVGNVNLLADRIITLLQQKVIRSKMSEVNVNKVKAAYSLEQMVKIHEEYYARLLES